MTRELNPFKWIILKFSEDLYKIFASWPAGYLDTEFWRLNSGIKNVEEDKDYYYFYGYSGSVYKCYKNSYGVIGSNNNFYFNKIITNTLCIVVNEDELEFLIPKLKLKVLEYKKV